MAVTSPILQSAALPTGPYTDAAGQAVNLATKTITVPTSGNMQFYRIRASTALYHYKNHHLWWQRGNNLQLKIKHERNRMKTTSVIKNKQFKCVRNDRLALRWP